MTELTVIPLPGKGTEDVVVATDGADRGAVFTGTVDGTIWRVSHDGTAVDSVATTGGRPLGIEYVDGRLLVCDAQRGVLWVDPATGGVEPLVPEVDGTPMKFCNNAAVASDGTIWFTDSSLHFGIERWMDELLLLTRTGRLLRLDPDGVLTTVLDGLAFANGVALAADESYVAVAQTSTRDVVRYRLSGPDSGTSDILCGDLPGYPDNMARGSDGLLWVALPGSTQPLLSRLHRGPAALRRVAARVPERLQPRREETVHVQAYDARGELVHDLDLTPRDGRATRALGFHMVTGVREHDGRVWMGSLEEPAIAFLDL